MSYLKQLEKEKSARTEYWNEMERIKKCFLDIQDMYLLEGSEFLDRMEDFVRKCKKSAKVLIE